MPSMHPLLRVVGELKVASKLELIPALQLLVTLGVTGGTSGYLCLTESILPYNWSYFFMVNVSSVFNYW